MNILSKLSTISALALLSFSATAETVCDKCEYIYYGRYLGAYWPGDIGTFKNTKIVADYAARFGAGTGHNAEFDDHWAFDLPAGGSVAMVMSTAAATRLDPNWAIQIFDDAGTLCDATRCTTIAYDENVARVILWGFATKFTVNTTKLPAGRYVIRIAGGTRATGESAYTGSLKITP